MYCSVLPLTADDAAWLIADIGGTHARLARWQASAGRTEQRQFENAGFGGLHELLATCLDGLARPVTRALRALAMSVTGVVELADIARGRIGTPGVLVG